MGREGKGREESPHLHIWLSRMAPRGLHSGKRNSEVEGGMKRKATSDRGVRAEPVVVFDGTPRSCDGSELRR